MCLSTLSVMEIRKRSPVKASSWLLTGFWSEVIVTSLFLSLPGERSSHDPTPSSLVHNYWRLQGQFDKVSVNKQKNVANRAKFFLSFFRPRDPSSTWERQDPGLHAISPCAGTPCGVLWWPLHRQTSLWVRRHYRFQWQLPWPSQWEARVEEIHRWTSSDVLLCKWQVSNSCSRKNISIEEKRRTIVKNSRRKHFQDEFCQKL